MKRKTATRITVVLVSLGILGFAVLKTLPSWVDTRALKLEIEDGLYQSTGVHFAIRELTLEPTLFHGFQVHLNTSTMTDIQYRPLGSIGNITVQIRYWPILTEQLPEIARVRLNHVWVPVGQQNLFKSLHLKWVKPKQTGFLKPAEMRDTEILLTDYKIEDTVPSAAVHRLLPLAKGFTLRGSQLDIRHLQSMHPISIVTQSELAFSPVQAWPPASVAQPKSLLSRASAALNPPASVVKAHLMLELSPLAPNAKSAFQPKDLRKLQLQLTGAAMDFNLQHQQDPANHQGEPTGTTSVHSPGLTLGHAQVLALQLIHTLGLPLPASLNQVALGGTVKLDHQLSWDFPASGQVRLRNLEGSLALQGLTVSPVNAPKRAWLSEGNGLIALHGQQVQTERFRLALDGLPVTLKGLFRLDNQRLNATIVAHHLKVTSLKETLARFGVVSPQTGGFNFQGLLDVDATVTGTLTQPQYRGLLSVQNARFQDEAQGLTADRLNGRLHFVGAGLQKPVVHYQGALHVADGTVMDVAQGLNVQHFDGDMAFTGQYQPGPSVPLPVYTGQLNIREAQYQDPKSGVLVSGIQGLIRLAGEWIHLDHFRGLLAGSTYTAQGQLRTNLKDYTLNLQSDRIDLPRLERELTPHFPAMKQVLAQLEPVEGLGKLNLTLRPNTNLSGRVTVNALVLRTGQPDYPLKVPSLTVLLDKQQFTIPETTLGLGDVPVRISGQGRQTGQYRMRLVSGEIPVALLRDNQKRISRLSGFAMPEIWNTAGGFRVTGEVTNQRRVFNLDFQNAGLSWAGGDFPVYDLSGALNFQQTGNGLPEVASHNLNFRYGNSPVSVSLDNHGQLNAVAEGVLSALSVNHFLVSRQSEATPYREVPFQATAHGVLAAMPHAGGKSRQGLPQNDVKTFLQFNLEPNFRHAYDGTVEVPGVAPVVAAAGADASSSAGLESGGGTGVALTHPVRSVTHVLNSARQVVQSGLDALIGSTPVSGQGLPVSGNAGTAGSQPPSGESGLGNSVRTEALSGSSAAVGSEVDEGNAPQSLPGDSGAAYLSSRWHWQGDNLQLEQARLHLFDAGDLLASGTVEQLFHPEKSVFLMRLATPAGIDLAQLSQGAASNLFFKGAKGQVKLDAQLVGNVEGPKLAAGSMEAQQVAIPYLTLRDATGRMTLDGETAQVVVDHFEIPGVAIQGTGHTLNLFEMPVSLEDVKIHGRMLSIDSLGTFGNLVVRPILVDQLAHNFMRPWQQGDPTIPIQFRNGDLTVDEVIYQNIILSHLTSQFSVYANSYFELSNASVEAAGGTAHGYLSMSPNDSSFTTLELNVDKVKANALTKALLNVTNQIFGDVNGTVRFTTYGDTDVAMQQNANGTVSVRVINGRLPAIARVETLLTTANILRGGILGLNLNNVLRSLTFYDTNYFATLSGDMLINNQVLYTRNLSSLGVNLDLLIRGSLRMDNGHANMLVDGRMRQVVAGKLGALGKFSLGGLVSYIPALGSFGKNKTGLLGYIPGVGWVPGFGGPAGDINRFRVRLMGDLNTPGAIQDFHWVR